MAKKGHAPGQISSRKIQDKGKVELGGGKSWGRKNRIATRVVWLQCMACRHFTMIQKEVGEALKDQLESTFKQPRSLSVAGTMFFMLAGPGEEKGPKKRGMSTSPQPKRDEEYASVLPYVKKTTIKWGISKGRQGALWEKGQWNSILNLTGEKRGKVRQSSSELCPKTSRNRKKSLRTAYTL